MEPKTSIVADRWARQECRVEYGVYFPDDTYVPFDGLQPAGDRRAIAPLVAACPDGWTSLAPVVLAEDGVRILGGETSWEGAGFLAVCEPDGPLKWLLHCEESEPFMLAELRNGIVIAVSSEYPHRFEWRLPLDSPWEADVSAAP
jgi:hypothetical protein